MTATTTPLGASFESPPDPEIRTRPDRIGRPRPSRTRLLAIERDRAYARMLATRSRALGWQLQVVSRPVAPEVLVAMRLNALVIDIALIGVEPYDYLERVCARLPGLTVVVCTGPSAGAQRVRGLRLGADAWLDRPCEVEELVAVVEAAVRGSRGSGPGEFADARTAGELVLRPGRYQAYVAEASVGLTAREFEILHVMMQSERVLRREEIHERVWGHARVPGDRSVDVFVRKLRRKLRGASPGWRYIHTHVGVGYRFDAERHTAPQPSLCRSPPTHSNRDREVR